MIVAAPTADLAGRVAVPQWPHRCRSTVAKCGSYCGGNSLQQQRGRSLMIKYHEELRLRESKGDGRYMNELNKSPRSLSRRSEQSETDIKLRPRIYFCILVATISSCDALSKPSSVQASEVRITNRSNELGIWSTAPAKGRCNKSVAKNIVGRSGLLFPVLVYADEDVLVYQGRTIAVEPETIKFGNARGCPVIGVDRRVIRQQ